MSSSTPRKQNAVQKGAEKLGKHVSSLLGIASKSLPEWLVPISDSAPCGPSLEYDQEYAVLRTRMMAKSDVQYGDFTVKPEPPDWADIERECRRLLLRSKDIDLYISLLRCRLQRAGTSGLREGLQMLRDVLVHYPDEVHPQKTIEGFNDPAVRANALAALADPDGLISELRDVVIVQNSAARLTIRDVERALSIPRHADALSSDAVQAQLDDLYKQKQSQRIDMFNAQLLMREIQKWCVTDLQDEAPDLKLLMQLLDKFTEPVGSVPITQTLNETPNSEAPIDQSGGGEVIVDDLTESFEEIALNIDNEKNNIVDANAEVGAYEISKQDFTEEVSTPFAPVGLQDLSGSNIAEQREQMRTYIQHAQTWFEQNEPSSPVGTLLKQANRLVGKRYSEIAHIIPLELLAKWDER